MADFTAYSVRFDGSSAYAQAPSVSAYDFGTRDFTIEAWVLTKTGGPVAAQMGSDTETGSGWGLFVLDDGRVELVTFNAGSTVIATTKAKTLVFDGSWHHLAGVRVGVQMQILFDGVPQPLDVAVNGLPPLDVSGNLPLTIGATTLVGSQSDRKLFTGSIDEVRLWNRALLTWEIDQNIYHIVTIKRENLVAQYGFDDKSGTDSSGKGNNLTFEGSVVFGDPAFYFVPEGQPFMAVQIRLMQDYQYDSANPSAAPKAVQALRVGLSPRNSDGTKRAADLTLTSDVATSVYSQGKSYAIGPTTPVTLKTNALNQVNISVFLLDDSLVAPVLKVHADFMGADERIVVSLDRQVHYDLSVVTGPDLQQPGDPLLNPKDFDAEQARGVADTISNVMTAAVQHDMQPSHDIVRAGPGTPIAVRTLSSRRVVRQAIAPGEPERENYLPVEMENPLLMPRSDLCRCHYLPHNETIERVVIPSFMAVPHFRFDVKTRSFTPMTGDAAKALILERMSGKHALSAAAGDMFVHPETGETMSAASLWDAFVNGLLDVVDWVVSIGESIADGMKVVISYVVDGVTKVFDFVVATVVEAADFVAGMIRAIGVALEKLIDFLAALFSPGDILRTHRIFYKFLQESSDFSLACIKDLKSSADGMFDSAKSTVDTYFDDAIDRLKGETGGSGTEPGNLAQPPSVQSDYVNQHVAESDLDQPTNVSAAPSDTVLSTSLNGVNTEGGSNFDALKQNNATTIQNFMTDAEGVMDQILAALLEALKASLDLAIDVAKAVVDAIFDLLISGYQMVLDMTDCRIDIPVITWFYEEVICQGDGSKLTFLNLLALGGALPATIVYKLVAGKAPFSESFETKFAAMTWQEYGFYKLPSEIFSNRASTAPAALLAVPNATLEVDDPDWKDVMSYVQGFSFGLSAFVWFAATAANDARSEGVLDAGFSTTWLAPVVVPEFVAQISSYPIYDDYSAGKPSSLEVSVWVLQWLPFAVDVADVVLASKKPAGATAKKYVDTVQNSLVGGWGIIHFILFATLLVWEEIAIAEDSSLSDDDRLLDGLDSGLKGVANVITTFPEIAGFARYFAADPKVKAGILVADGAAAVAAVAVTFGRTVGAILRNHAMQAR